MEKTKVQELDALNEYYNTGDNQIVIVYGHIRTGSATVITAFSEGKDYLYYCACPASERLQQYLIGDAIRKKGYEVSEYPSYKEITEAIEKYAVDLNKPLVVFVENFEDIIKASPGFIEEISSVIYRNNHPQIMVVLMGANAAWIENSMVEKIGAQAANISGFLKIKPYSFQEMRKRFSNMSDEDVICTYSIFGGNARLWNYFDDKKTFKENVCDKFLDAWNSVLLRETFKTLEENLRETAVYNTIMFGLANGKNKLNDIHHATGFSRAKIMVYLKSLIELGMVEKVYSFATTGHENVQKGVYRICDPLAHFFYRFFYANITQIIRLDAEEYFDTMIADGLDEYVSSAYKAVCREYVVKLSEYGRLPFKIDEEGEWVGKIDSLDIVAQSESGDTLVGACYWNELMDVGAIEKIRNCCKKARINPDYYYLFSSKGFTDGLKELAAKEASIKLIELEEMMNA
ncbi:ATP-binding protein [Butyrivibrio sp. JL13D10]|uniref:ATP-binding protein n=1 Tax=Butyrivibrio sp. JL13D10 TaxID=3236815 RepID=UPI0038B4542F